MNYLNENTQINRMYRFPMKSANKPIVAAFYCTVMNYLCDETNNNNSTNTASNVTGAGTDSGTYPYQPNGMAHKKKKTTHDTGNTTTSTMSVAKLREYANIARNHPEYYRILMHGGELVNATLTSLISELISMGFKTNECREVIVKLCKVKEMQNTATATIDLSGLELPDVDTAMFAILAMREEEEQAKIREYEAKCQAQSNSNTGSQTNAGSDTRTADEIAEMKWLEEAVAMEDRIILESEKEKEVIQVGVCVCLYGCRCVWV